MIVRHVNRQSKHKIGAWNQLTKQVLQQAGDLALPAIVFKDAAVTPQLTVIWAGPRVIRQMNRETRQIDRLTDVLSFPLLECEAGSPKKQLVITDFDLTYLPDFVLPLGDIVLSVDQALEQAKDYGHSMEREIAFLSVHGLLHLIGYDHQTKEQESKMRAQQRSIMQILGINRKEGSDQ